jgi:hypothetical protein
MKENKSALKDNKSALKDNKSALKENMLQHGQNIAYLQIIQTGLPIYVLLLSGNNCLLYSSISISLNQSQNGNEIRTFDRLTGIA